LIVKMASTWLTVINDRCSRRVENGRHRGLRPALMHTGPPAGRSQVQSVEELVYKRTLLMAQSSRGENGPFCPLSKGMTFNGLV